MDYIDKTLDHVWKVQRNIGVVVSELEIRGRNHDESKLFEPESTEFARLTPLLAESTYGSDEYNGFLKELGDALKHHYANNAHHPEHFKTGISGMTLVDLVEMFCDWLAAAKRHSNGNIYKSIELNTERFKMSEQLKSIFENTAEKLFNETR